MVVEEALVVAARESMAGGGRPPGRPPRRPICAASIGSGQCVRLWPQWRIMGSVSEMVYFSNSLTHSVWG